MTRGKNYVNNNRGVYLQSGPKGKNSMKLCEYGIGCNRPDCIYRHEEGRSVNGGRMEVCIPYLAGKCSFEEKGCRKRHPSKDEVARLLAKYKRTRCRFGDDCYTDSCLYLHPRDATDQVEPSFIEPHHFPPLQGGGINNRDVSTEPVAQPKPIPNSAWNAAPVGRPNKSASGPSPAPPGSASEIQEQHSQPQMSGQGPPLSQQQEHGTPTEQFQPWDRPQLVQQEARPQSGWGYPNSQQLQEQQHPTPSQPHHHHHYPDMMMPPPPPMEYYGAPTVAGGGHPFPMVDPNTGYPIDPAYYGPNFYHPEQQHYPHMMMATGMPFPSGVLPTHYGIPFNVEAKEFIPGGSTSY